MKRDFYTFSSSNDKSRAILKSAYPAPDGYDYKNNITQLEHIIPRKWEEYWGHALDSQLESYNHNKPFEEKLDIEQFSLMLINRIGNHTLLFKADNIVASNHGYETKKQEYLKSNITCTKDIPAEFDDFNLESINKRAENIFNKIILAWKS